MQTSGAQWVSSDGSVHRFGHVDGCIPAHPWCLGDAISKCYAWNPMIGALLSSARLLACLLDPDAHYSF